MVNKIFQTKAKLIKTIELTRKYYKIVLSCAQIARISGPGQFVEIKVAESYEPLLRRPFGIHRVRGPHIEILYEIVGEGTKILSQRKPGERLDIIGPLGNGFDCLSPVLNQSSPILVAGGMGVAPLLFLAEKLAHPSTSLGTSSVERIAYRKRKLSATRNPLNAKVLIGAKTKSDVLCEREFKQLGCNVKIATDDGSRGFKGKVTDLLKSFLRTTHDARRTTIYACGPKPMLAEISRISCKYNIPAYVSLEEHMACGIGACMGCVIKLKVSAKGGPAYGRKNSKRKTDFEYKRVCKEGPVFSADQIIWE